MKSALLNGEKTQRRDRDGSAVGMASSKPQNQTRAVFLPDQHRHCLCCFGQVQVASHAVELETYKIFQFHSRVGCLCGSAITVQHSRFVMHVPSITRRVMMECTHHVIQVYIMIILT